VTGSQPSGSSTSTTRNRRSPGGSGSRTTITGLDIRDRAEIASIQITVRGQVRDQLQLLNVPRLGFMTKVGMDPASFGGEGVTRARFVLPLVGDLRMDQVSVSGTSEAKGFALKRAAAVAVRATARVRRHVAAAERESRPADARARAAAAAARRRAGEAGEVACPAGRVGVEVERVVDLSGRRGGEQAGNRCASKETIHVRVRASVKN
jgi:hypothetical protein